MVVLNTMLGVGPVIDVETFIRIERDGGGVLSVLTLAELPKWQSGRRARINLLDERIQVGEGFEDEDENITSVRRVACAS